MGAGYDETSGPSTPLVFPIEVVTAAILGFAVLIYLALARTTSRDGVARRVTRARDIPRAAIVDVIVQN